MDHPRLQTNWFVELSSLKGFPNYKVNLFEIRRLLLLGCDADLLERHCLSCNLHKDLLMILIWFRFNSFKINKRWVFFQLNYRKKPYLVILILTIRTTRGKSTFKVIAIIETWIAFLELLQGDCKFQTIPISNPNVGFIFQVFGIRINKI